MGNVAVGKPVKMLVSPSTIAGGRSRQVDPICQKITIFASITGYLILTRVFFFSLLGGFWPSIRIPIIITPE